MPKAEAGTPKDIANRAKARGLQKLKFWCQACEKQCRDENGFKCHCASEAHVRQMSLFAQNAEGFMDTYSSTFDKTFMELLSRRFGTRRVAANLVYNELIQDKEHTHMNSTMWATLTDYVGYLGRTGKAMVEETERGWFITYIDRDPEAARRATAAARLRELNSAESARFEDEVEQRASAAAAAAAVGGADAPTSHSLGALGGDGAAASASAPRLGNIGALSVHARMSNSIRISAHIDGDSDEEEEDVASDDGGGTARPAGSAVSVGTKRSRWDNASTIGAASRTSNLASIIEEERSSKTKRINAAAAVAAAASAAAVTVEIAARREDWLLPGIVVKMMDATVGGGAYYRAKGEVIAVENTFGARLKMIDSGDTLLVDAADLETVVPKEGGQILLLQGRHRGALADIARLRVEDFGADVRLVSTGEVIEKVPYEDFSKAAV
jgi:DNA/RNA-binding protein KIN17